MTALTAQIQRERRAIAEAWRSGFVTGCMAGIVVMAIPVVILFMLTR